MSDGPSICAVVRTVDPTTATLDAVRAVTGHVDRVLVAAHHDPERLAAALPDVDVVALPLLEHHERADGLVQSLVAEDWVLWIAEGEVVSDAALAELRSLVADPDVTHYRFGDDGDRFETRLFRNDPALVHLPGQPATGPVAVGPHHLRRHARGRLVDGDPLPEGAAPVADRFSPAAVDAHWRDRALCPADYAAALRIVEPGPTFEPSEQRWVFITVRNLGQATWPGRGRSGPEIRMAYRWLTDPGGELVVTPGTATRLLGDVGPGVEVTVQANIQAPAEPGRYRLEIDMLNQSVRWFGHPVVVPVELGA